MRASLRIALAIAVGGCSTRTVTTTPVENVSQDQAGSLGAGWEGCRTGDDEPKTVTVHPGTPPLVPLEYAAGSEPVRTRVIVSLWEAEYAGTKLETTTPPVVLEFESDEGAQGPEGSLRRSLRVQGVFLPGRPQDEGSLRSQLLGQTFTFTRRPSGELCGDVSISQSNESATRVGALARTAVLQLVNLLPVFPATPVGVGGTWSVRYLETGSGRERRRIDYTLVSRGGGLATFSLRSDIPADDVTLGNGQRVRVEQVADGEFSLLPSGALHSGLLTLSSETRLLDSSDGVLFGQSKITIEMQGIP